MWRWVGIKKERTLYIKKKQKRKEEKKKKSGQGEQKWQFETGYSYRPVKKVEKWNWAWERQICKVSMFGNLFRKRGQV